MIDLLNALDDADDPDEPDADIRELLHRHDFARALVLPRQRPSSEWSRAPASWPRRCGGFPTRIPRRSRPGSTANSAASTSHRHSPNTTERACTSTGHRPRRPFDDQVIADFLMALSQEVCDHGTTRFGVSAATDCDHLFFDATRNGSRRFCADPRCASRTHTADHRARQRAT